MIREMVPSDHELLRTQLEDFDFSNPPTDPMEVAHDLVDTMKSHDGLGLSANQIGLPYRAFAMRTEPAFVCFNPKIVYTSNETTILEEGCLSFPNLIYKVRRPNIIRVRFMMPNGETTTKTFDGMTARIFCHEMMHMDGILPFEGIGRMKLEKAIKAAEKRGSNYRTLGLMKHA